MQAKRIYHLENTQETERLQKQADSSVYSLKDEFALVDIKAGSHVLDAGCGSGMVTRFLAETYSKIKVDGCDLSDLRLKDASKLSQSFSNIRFFQSPLESIEAENASYDSVVCRYVFEHLKTPSNAAAEFFRVLKPGSSAHVIDFDGVIFNLFPMSEKLRKMSDQLIAGMPIDLYVGRKIPELLGKAGFKDIKWSVQVSGIQGRERDLEKANTEMRFGFAQGLIEKILGSKGEAQEFQTLYLTEMMNENSVLFYNKFIVTGTKPAS